MVTDDVGHHLHSSPVNVSTDFRNKIRWLLVARIGMFVLIATAVVFLFSTKGFLFKLLFAYGVITLGYLLSLTWWAKTRREVSFKFLCGVQLFFELLVEAGVVHYSGGAASPFIILFGLSIITSAFIFELVGTLITATGAVLLYGAVVILEYKGLLEFSTTFPMVEVLYEDGELLFFTAYVYSCFRYLIAFLIGYLSGRLRTRVGELHKAGEALRRVQMDTDDILMHMRSGLITLDPDGRVVYFNQAAGEILDVDQRNVRGRFLTDILPPNARSFSMKLSELLDMGGSRVRTGEFELEKPNEENRNMRLACSFLVSPDGSLRGIIALFEDITDQKRREEYLKEVEKMAAIGELSASLAHEIRNPLAAIRASVETLATGEPSSDKEKEQRLMGLIVKETDRLTRVLDEFLVFARLKELPADHVTYNRIDLVDIVSEVIEMLEGYPGFSNGISIDNKLDGHLWAFGREGQLKDVFYNILINASESIGNKGGTVTIEKAREREGFYAAKRLVGISFTDTGAGIPEKAISHIFTPFYSNKPRGTGLGLAIAQGIVNRHRGIIEAENVQNGGARFTVYLLKAPEPIEE